MSVRKVRRDKNFSQQYDIAIDYFNNLALLITGKITIHQSLSIASSRLVSVGLAMEIASTVCLQQKQIFQICSFDFENQR